MSEKDHDNLQSNKESSDSGFIDMNRKIEASLLPAIEEHVNSSDFDAAKDGLDFLNVKNSMLLSYMIDLTYRVRQGITDSTDSAGDENKKNRHRLTEMKTALDKTRPLEKKMRYQLDKLLTTSSSATFASKTGDGAPDDPLQYRPDPKAFDSDDDDDSSSSEDDSGKDGANDEEISSNDDDDLQAAKATLARARIKGKPKNDGLYRAPRLASMPYPLDDDGGTKERQKRLDRRLHTSELVQTLRSQYGEAPEQEDVHGASDFGKQREAARRLAEREAERTRFEEDAMVRLTTSRKEKKERKRLLRQESSNLSAISDLGNLVRGVSAAFQDDDKNEETIGDDISRERYENGKRKRSAVDPVTGRTRKKGPKIGSNAKNSLQMALYGKEQTTKKKRRR